MARDVIKNRPTTQAQWDATHKEIGIDKRTKKVVREIVANYNEKIPRIERALVEAENAPSVIVVDDPNDSKGWTTKDMTAQNAEDVALFKDKLIRLNNKLEICKNKVGG